ncbi:M4 family metallopeptidase [Runella salmonicolor]|uniref:M4 family metallopeptidase n=1 Tax=Runella salmonicolor TaxID=2950278 RepID=A0ABT1FT95_9BACT|nr:M4 family metallopeptidase [Runella salmonicolor]MCP1384974.1 M4 family metallopeptidase [Runella salmonicolor]
MRQRHYQLYYKNIPVEGVIFSLHSEADVLTIAHGKIPEGLNQDISKPMPEPKALEIALGNMKVTLEELEKMGRKKPEGTLLLARLSDDVASANFRLCYVFAIYGNETLNAFKVYVDASTGEIVKKISLIHNCFKHTDKNPVMPIGNDVVTVPASINAPLVTSTFIPNYPRFANGQLDLTFDTSPQPASTNNEHWLRSFDNALITQRLHPNNQIGDVINIGNDWRGNIDNRNAQTAHWLAQRMFQFMSQSPTPDAPIGRDGVNGMGSYPRQLTDWPANGAGWSSNTNQITYGLSNGNSTVTIDVVGHEYMHAVTFNAVPNGLEYQGESGALNESISDIFGTALERHIMINPQSANNPNGWNWDLGEDVGLALRNMANPLASLDVVQPDRYYGPNWANTCGSCDDFGGVHINSGVMNRWFNMLCTGFNNPNITTRVNAIDFNRALAIVYKALTTYIQQYSSYPDMRNATIYAARDLYGDCSMEMRQVQNAWFLTDNNPWTFCPVDCNYTINTSVSNSNPSCNTPITLSATCTGSGCYDINYSWSNSSGTIGSGQSITINAPATAGIHTYTVYPTKSGCNFSYNDVSVNVNCGGNSSTCPNTGSISYQRWNNIGGGTSIQDLRNNTNNLNNTPSHTQTLSLFEAPTDIADNYGVRIRGYVCPPTTGNYTFWIAGDDNSELWISPNDQPSNLSRIAYHSAWTPSREWGWHGTQQSAPITLQAGQRYYVEALMKEGGGGDNLAVGWQLPSGALERPIPSNRLIPFDGGGGTPPSGCGSGTGLSATYFSGTALQGSPIATYTQGPIDYAGTQGQTISGTSVAGNNISARWEGQVEAPASGMFNFNMRTDDGVRVWFNNVQVVDDFGDYPPKDHNFNVNLTAGQKYNIKIEWKQGGGGYEAKLFWSYPNQGNQIVPACRLYSASGGGSSCNFSVSASSNNGNPGCGAGITLTAGCTGSDCGSVSYAWSGNGLNGSGASVNTNVPSSNGTYTYTVTASKAGCGNQTANANVTVSGCSGGTLNQCLEAESASGNGPITSDPNASNGQTRGAENNNNHYVDYVVTNVPSAGTYSAKLRYYGGGNVTLTVNGGNAQSVSLPYSGSWNIVWTEYTFTVSLNAGSNTIRVQGTGGNSTRQDRMCLTGGGSGGSSCNFSVTASSNNGNPGCGAGITLTAGCTGSDCGSVSYAWSGNGLNGSGASVNTNVPSSNGTYTYTVTASKAGCGNQTANANVTVSGCSGGSANCSAESIQCSGNQYEIRNYTVSASGAGTYTIKAHYRSHEGPGVIRWSVNGGSVQTVNVNQTGINDYLEISLGTASLNSGNNVINLSSGSAYICIKKACIQSGARVGAANEVNSEPMLIEAENTVQLYPNPTNGKITLRYYLEKGQKARLQFSNLTGGVITQKTLVGEGGWQQDQTDLSHQPNGAYLLRFEADKRSITRKFMIVK